MLPPYRQRYSAPELQADVNRSATNSVKTRIMDSAQHSDVVFV